MLEKLKDNRRIIFLAIVVIFFLIAIGWAAYLRYVKGLSWADRTGFESITVWDLLDLIIVPVLLALGAYWLNQQQKIRDTRKEEVRQRETARIEEERRQEAARIEADRQQESALQRYLDDMSILLLDKELLGKTADSIEHKVAQIRTVTAIRVIGKKRIDTLLHFLRSAGLVNSIFIKSDMSDIDLSEVYLIQVNLSQATLRQANLRRVYLRKANLSGANLRWAILHGANLSDADLSGADLRWAILRGANLSHADLSRADLSGVNLSQANLRGTDLSRADLRGADLSRTDLSNADLEGAKYDESTYWSEGFDPIVAGAELIE